MLSFLLLATASAQTLSVRAEIHGSDAAWTIEDATPGRVLTEQVDLPGRRHAEVTLDYAVSDDGTLDFVFVVTEVRDRRLRADTRTVLSRPMLRTRAGVEAWVALGPSEGPPDVKLVVNPTG